MQLENDRGRALADAAPNVTAGDKPSLRAVAAELTFLQRQVIVEAFNQAWPTYWERRARQLEAARPAPGDHHGMATREELSARWRSLTAAAAACRARGRMPELMADEVNADLDNVLDEMYGARPSRDAHRVGLTDSMTDPRSTEAVA